MNVLVELKEGTLYTPDTLSETEWKLSRDNSSYFINDFTIEFDSIEILTTFSDKMDYLFAAGAYIKTGKEYNAIIDIMHNNFPWIKKIKLKTDLIPLTPSNRPALLSKKYDAQLLEINGHKYIPYIETKASAKIFTILESNNISINDFLFNSRYVILINDEDVEGGILTQLTSTCLLNHKNIHDIFWI